MSRRFGKASVVLLAALIPLLAVLLLHDGDSPAHADHGESTPRFAKPGVQQLVINGPVITGDLQ